MFAPQTLIGHAHPLLCRLILLGFEKRLSGTGGGLRAQAGFHQSRSRLGGGVADRKPCAAIGGARHWNSVARRGRTPSAAHGSFSRRTKQIRFC